MEKEPRDKWSPLHLKMWRAQQRVAARLRKEYRRFRTAAEDSSLPGASIGRSVHDKLAVVARISLLERFKNGEAQGMPSLEQRSGLIVPLSVGIDGRGHRLGQMRVFGRVFYPRMWHLRALQVATTEATKLITLPRCIFQAVSGGTCLVCSGFHSTLSCLTDFDALETRNLASLYEARARIDDVASTLEDREDDFVRCGALLLEISKARLARKVGVSGLGWRIAKKVTKSVIPFIGIFTSLLGICNEASYIVRGGRFVDIPTQKSLLRQFLAGENILGFIEAERLRHERKTRAVIIPEARLDVVPHIEAVVEMEPERKPAPVEEPYVETGPPPFGWVTVFGEDADSARVIASQIHHLINDELSVASWKACDGHRILLDAYGLLPSTCVGSECIWIHDARRHARNRGILGPLLKALSGLRKDVNTMVLFNQRPELPVREGDPQSALKKLTCVHNQVHILKYISDGWSHFTLASAHVSEI